MECKQLLLTLIAVRIWLLLSSNWLDVREMEGQVDIDLIIRTMVFTFYLTASTL